MLQCDELFILSRKKMFGSGAGVCMQVMLRHEQSSFNLISLLGDEDVLLLTYSLEQLHLGLQATFAV